VVDILADIVLNPSFDPEELERERKVIFEEIKMVEDTPDDLVHEIFIESFWPDHPLGLPILGTRESVEALDREQLLRFFRETYTPANLIVSAAGNLDHENLIDLIERQFRPASGKRTSSKSIWSWAPSPPRRITRIATPASS
jgi:predicted Zn-dependent peptidase